VMITFWRVSRELKNINLPPGFFLFPDGDIAE
jgi:hypothetical protein